MPALETLAEGGSSPKIDIVAVHGLNPRNKDTEQHAFDTWRKPSGDQGKLWLQTDLPQDLPDARVFLYKYESRPVFGGSGPFWDAANYFLECLLVKRHRDPRRPLILVAHSLGGLLIKQALVNAHNNKRYEDIAASVTGLVTFGTPHEGGNTKDAQVKIGLMAAKIARALGFGNEGIIQILTPGSLFSGFLTESFRHQLENFHIVSFYEEKSTIVTKDSATFGLAGHRENILGLDADHSGICKFNTALKEDRDRYEIVGYQFRWLYERAMEKVAATETERQLDEQWASMKASVGEQTSPPSTSQPEQER